MVLQLGNLSQECHLDVIEIGDRAGGVGLMLRLKTNSRAVGFRKYRVSS